MPLLCRRTSARLFKNSSATQLTNRSVVQVCSRTWSYFTWVKCQILFLSSIRETLYCIQNLLPDIKLTSNCFSQYTTTSSFKDILILVNENKCTTVNEQQCNTVNEQKCSTVNERKCNTVQKQQCSTVNEQQCNTVNEQKCRTVNKQQCSTTNQRVRLEIYYYLFLQKLSLQVS